MMGAAVVDTKIRYVHRDTDRHGNERIYFQRRRGPKIRMKAKLDTPEFLIEYQAALGVEGKPRDPRKAKPAKDTLRGLVVEYLGSAEYRGLDPKTRATKRLLLEHCLAEKVAPEDARLYADVPLRALTGQSIRVLRDRKASLPNAANDRLKALKRLFEWAVENDKIVSNPARDVRRLKPPKGGHHTWTVEEIRQYEAKHPIGTKARLALALLLWTGQRRSDIVLFGPQHIKGGWLRFTQFKNRNRNPVQVDQPVMPELESIIAATVCGLKTFLVTDYGESFSGNGFGNKFREWCDGAALYHCSAHGMRKAAASIAAEKGATDAQLMAYFGWLTPEQAAYYRKQARRKKLAAQMPALLLAEEQTGSELTPTLKSGEQNV